MPKEKEGLHLVCSVPEASAGLGSCTMKRMETWHRDVECIQRERLPRKGSVESEEFHKGSGECRGKQGQSNSGW